MVNTMPMCLSTAINHDLEMTSVLDLITIYFWLSTVNIKGCIYVFNTCKVVYQIYYVERY